MKSAFFAYFDVRSNFAIRYLMAIYAVFLRFQKKGYSPLNLIV